MEKMQRMAADARKILEDGNLKYSMSMDEMNQLRRMCAEGKTADAVALAFNYGFASGIIASRKEG